MAHDYNVMPSINSELEAHKNLFENKVYRVADNVYSVVGWTVANVVMIEGDDGVILVDVGRELETSTEIKAELLKITPKPIRAIIYTHFHPDHTNGVKAFVSEDQVKSGEVSIYAHETLMQNVMGMGGVLSPILGLRARYTFGALLDGDDLNGMSMGIGPYVRVGTPSFIAPTHTYKDRLELNICGVRMVLIHVPSEAPDETAVYLPDSNVMLTAEVIQGPSLPNLHALRGDRFRDPVPWFKSIDVLRSFHADYMVPGHGQPVYGAENVEEVLRMVRDGIQFVHDQTVRYMNKGLTPDELVHAVKFPPHLENYKPYLREYYGTVSHSIRQFYVGYLGWFEGDPVALDPTPRDEQAKRLVDLMGGSDKVLDEARKAYDKGEYQWAAELATYLIDIDSAHTEARLLKAAVFRQLGYAQININWRNWYLTSARELEGNLTPAGAQRRPGGQNFSPPDITKAFPSRALVEGLTVRLIAESTLDVNTTLGLEVRDTGESFSIEIRRGVAQIHDGTLDAAIATISMDRDYLNTNQLGIQSVADGISSGDIEVRGEPADVEKFFEYFEPAGGTIRLTHR